MSTYEPGTVAVATVNGDENVRVFRTGCPSNMGWEFNHSDGRGHGWSSDRSDRVTDIRPLVVLDLDESVGKASLPDWLRNNAAELERGVVSPSSFFKDMTWLADQIERQTKPPRISEPGLWGVVEGREGNRWVRESLAGGLDWRHLGPTHRVTAWRGIEDCYSPLRVLRDGIEATS